MSNRPQKIRRIFRELRNAVGPEIPAVELLRLANLLVTEPVEHNDYAEPAWRPNFERVPLDRAFADGGWRVLEGERRWVREVYNDDETNFLMERAA